MSDELEQPQAPDIDPGEAALAALGASRLLTGTPLTPDEMTRAQGVGGEIRTAIGRYLRGEGGGSYARGADDDLPALPPPEAAGVADDPDVAVDVGTAVTRALQRLDKAIPQRSLGGLQDDQAQATWQERSAKRRARAALEKLPAVLGDLDALSEDQLQVIRDVMPTVAAALPVIAMEEMAAVNRRLSKRQERGVARILGLSTGREAVAEYQAVYQREAQEKAKQARGELATPTGATPMQRTAQQ
jgi:hypothetical protein